MARCEVTSESIGLAVVDLVQDPKPAGSLTRSTTCRIFNKIHYPKIKLLGERQSGVSQPEA